MVLKRQEKGVRLNMSTEILSELEAKVKTILPSEERRKKGPYALFECFQNIPCNPCYTACKFHAVKPLTTITDTPETYFDNCVGCGACILACPGLAAFVIDESYSDTESLVKIPYEYMPLPEKDSVVDGVNRIGEAVCRVRVDKVVTTKNKTSIVTLIVPKEYTHVVRGIRLKEEKELISNDLKDVEIGESIVCRCEDVSAEEIAATLNNGSDTFKQIKFNTRVSMGPCQGKTCISLVMKELAAKTGKSIDELQAPTYRQPIRPIKVGSFLNEE